MENILKYAAAAAAGIAAGVIGCKVVETLLSDDAPSTGVTSKDLSSLRKCQEALLNGEKERLEGASPSPKV